MMVACLSSLALEIGFSCLRYTDTPWHPLHLSKLLAAPRGGEAAQLGLEEAFCRAKLPGAREAVFTDEQGLRRTRPQEKKNTRAAQKGTPFFPGRILLFGPESNTCAQIRG